MRYAIIIYANDDYHKSINFWPRLGVKEKHIYERATTTHLKRRDLDSLTHFYYYFYHVSAKAKTQI